MSLSGAAAALGLPEALVQRSAAARAAETGQSVDEILAAWAGGEAVAAAPSEPRVPASETVPGAMEDTTPEPTPEPALTTPEPVIAAPASGAASAAPTRKPVPAEVTFAEAAHLPEVITVPTAGIKERTNFVIPAWLTGLMLVIPLVALFALGGSATGTCGEATELATDIISGEIVNCDGSAFTGGGIDGGPTDFVARGAEIYNGQAVTGVNCSSCHGVNGEGAATFPALTGVVTTFGACSDHIEWVTLGSAGWEAAYGNTYGDTNKPVQRGMPAFGGSLTGEQLAAVVAFERVRFGGANPEETPVDCGLAEPEEGGGEGEEGASTGTTVPTEGDPEAAAASSG